MAAATAPEVMSSSGCFCCKESPDAVGDEVVVELARSEPNPPPTMVCGPVEVTSEKEVMDVSRVLGEVVAMVLLLSSLETIVFVAVAFALLPSVPLLNVAVVPPRANDVVNDVAALLSSPVSSSDAVVDVVVAAVAVFDCWTAFPVEEVYALKPLHC
ncbi:hypothetical protein KC331_g70 [Hortaea werneckii]|nr:hypothetical protein KC331_g70 [Hortaea werneckii]